MYGRDSSETASNELLSFFIGSTLTQVCFGKYDLQLKFDGPPSCVTIESSFAVQEPGGPERRGDIRVDFGDVAELGKVLNCDVTAAAWGAAGTLLITFENGETLSIFDDSDQYESFTIRQGKTLIVI